MSAAEVAGADTIGRWYWRTRYLTAPFRNQWLNISYEGRDNVPDTGGVLLAANHLSFIDSLILMYSLPRQVTFLGKAEYLTSPTTRRLFPAAGMIPVDRSGRGVARSLNQAQQCLNNDGLIGIFPEGTRSRDGLLHRGHAGVAHLALRARVPIVPVGIIGTDQALPPGETMVDRRVPIRLRFGAPISVAPWATGPSTAKVKRQITDQVMAAIGQLSGQRDQDDYAPVPALERSAGPRMPGSRS